MQRRTVLALAAVAAAFAAFAAHAEAADTSVTVSGCSTWQFSPRSVSVDEGDVVTFSNPSAVSGCLDSPHTATSTASPPAWDTGNVPVGSSASVTMTESGTFSYRCAYHPSMTGTIVVHATETDMAPSVSIVSPKEGALLEPGVVRVSGTASGDTTSVSLIVDGAAPVPVSGTTAWTFDWDTSSLAVGSAHTLEAVAADGRQISRSKPVHVTLARPDAAPKLAFYAPRPSATLSGIVLVNGTAIDDRGLQRIDVRIDADDWRPASGTTEWRLMWDTREVADGTHVLEARATDTGGNVAFAPSVAVTVKNAAVTDPDDADDAPPPTPNAPPVVGAHRPAEGETVAGAVAFRVAARDPEGDALTIQLRVDGALLLTSSPPLVYTWPEHLASPGPHVASALVCDEGACASRRWNFTVLGEEIEEAPPETPAVEPPPQDPDRRKTVEPKASPAPSALLVALAALLRRRQEPGA